MNSETYTPGHTENATDFMAKRTLESHGSFFLPYLQGNLSVLDCGCGPGTITLSIAAHVSPGQVVGVDAGQSQIDRGASLAAQAGMRNVRFQRADCYALPFASNSFDRVFSHALMEHLADPERALRELFRVLKPTGVIGVCSPDWGGFVLAPPSRELSHAIEAYKTLQSNNGGNVTAGRYLGAHLQHAGFAYVSMSARYECYPSLNFIGDYLAMQLQTQGDDRSARALKDWSVQPSGMFAQTWVSAIGVRP